MAYSCSGRRTASGSRASLWLLSKPGFIRLTIFSNLLIIMGSLINQTNAGLTQLSSFRVKQAPTPAPADGHDPLLNRTARGLRSRSYHSQGSNYWPQYQPRYMIEAPQRSGKSSGIGELLLVLAPMAAIPLIGSAALTTFTTLYATQALSGKSRRKRHIVTRELLEWKLASTEDGEGVGRGEGERKRGSNAPGARVTGRALREGRSEEGSAGDAGTDDSQQSPWKGMDKKRAKEKRKMKMKRREDDANEDEGVEEEEREETDDDVGRKVLQQIQSHILREPSVQLVNVVPIRGDAKEGSKDLETSGSTRVPTIVGQVPLKNMMPDGSAPASAASSTSFASNESSFPPPLQMYSTFSSFEESLPGLKGEEKVATFIKVLEKKGKSAYTVASQGPVVPLWAPAPDFFGPSVPSSSSFPGITRKATEKPRGDGINGEKLPSYQRVAEKGHESPASDQDRASKARDQGFSETTNKKEDKQREVYQKSYWIERDSEDTKVGRGGGGEGGKGGGGDPKSSQERQVDHKMTRNYFKGDSRASLGKRPDSMGLRVDIERREDNIDGHSFPTDVRGHNQPPKKHGERFMGTGSHPLWPQFGTTSTPAPAPTTAQAGRVSSGSLARLRPKTDDKEPSVASFLSQSDFTTWMPLLSNPYLVDIAKSEGSKEISELDIIQKYLNEMRPEGDYNDEIIATYLSCNGMLSLSNHCLERLTCHFTDPTSGMKDLEKDVSSLIIYAILKNSFIESDFKARLRKSAELGRSIPGRCGVYACDNVKNKSKRRKA